MGPRQPGRVWGREVASADLSRATRRLQGQTHWRHAQPRAETCSDLPHLDGKHRRSGCALVCLLHSDKALDSSERRCDSR